MGISETDDPKSYLLSNVPHHITLVLDLLVRAEVSARGMTLVTFGTVCSLVLCGFYGGHSVFTCGEYVWLCMYTTTSTHPAT